MAFSPPIQERVIDANGRVTPRWARWFQTLLQPETALSVNWGDIGGSIGDQNDLQTSLSGKVNTGDLSELIDDRVSNLLVAGSNITLTYDDVSGTLTIASGSSGGGNSYFPSGF
jgi:hypothetical protein